MILILYGYLLLGMLCWGYGRVGPDGVGPRHVTNGVKELGNASFNSIMSQTRVVVQGEVILGDCAFRVDVGGVEALEQRQCTRMGLKMDMTVVEGGFYTLKC